MGVLRAALVGGEEQTRAKLLKLLVRVRRAGFSPMCCLVLIRSRGQKRNRLKLELRSGNIMIDISSFHICNFCFLSLHVLVWIVLKIFFKQLNILSHIVCC